MLIIVSTLGIVAIQLFCLHMEDKMRQEKAKAKTSAEPKEAFHIS